ncbi:MAG: CAP domain-containing protein [Leptolyngbyaceae bacterium]|nr:CAP domain-containing protein [Leptolyngbyaceae bacterium]
MNDILLTKIAPLAIATLLLSASQPALTFAQASSQASSQRSVQRSAHRSAQKFPTHRVLAQHTTFSSEDVWVEINRLRSNPSAYADWLESTRHYYDGTILRWPGMPPIQTFEGRDALERAVDVLRRTQPLPPLELTSGLSQAASDHVQDLSQSGRLSLRGSDGSTTEDRVRRYGNYEGRLLEIVSQGVHDPKAMVAALVVDDGNARRTNQHMLLQPEFRYAGISCIPDRPGVLCVANVASRYQENSDVRPVVGSSDNETTDPFTEALTPERLATLAAEIVDETNQLRRNPVEYAARMAALYDYYEGNIVRIPGQPAVEVTEGLPALEEAIEALERADSAPMLTSSPVLTQGATDHARDIGPSGNVGHYGSDGSAPIQRVSRYGVFPPNSLIGETISFGPPTLAEWHVFQLLIDDGVPDRSHRKALLNAEYRLAGVACEPHAIFRIVCVSVYASDEGE